MAIQYSGGPNINTTFTCASGTRQEIVTGIQEALKLAQWTVISGENTANVVLESATTPAPQSLVCRVQLQDTGANCAYIRFRNQAGTKAQTNQHCLLPLVGRVFRVIANKYQFFCFSSDSISVGRSFVAGGVPYLPSFLQGFVTECIWSHSNTKTDSDGTLVSSFRTTGFTGTDSLQASSFQVVNGNSWETYNAWSGYNGAPGCQTLMAQVGCTAQNIYISTTYPYRWHDGSLLTYEPLIAWGLTRYQDEAMIRGQLWDAACVTSQFISDQTTSFDSKNWWVLTHNSSPQIPVSLFLVVPT